MKRWKECTRLQSVSEQVFAHVFLGGFLGVAGLIGHFVAAERSLMAIPPSAVFILIGAISVGYWLLISTNRITFVDDESSTIEIRSMIFYWFCRRRQTFLINDLRQLALITKTDFEGDESYQLELVVESAKRSFVNDAQKILLQPTAPLRIAIQYATRLDPVLRTGERLSKQFGTKLIQIESPQAPPRK